MAPGIPGEWDEEIIAPSSVLYYDSAYHIWYAGGSFIKQDLKIGHATSPDGITWTKDMINNPILDAGPEGAWDDDLVLEPTVLFNESIFHMWYAGHSGTDLSKGVRIGHATSMDGVTWTKDTVNNPVVDLGPEGSPDNGWISGSSVIYNGNEYHMWYNAYNGTNLPIHVCHATSPDGVTWTKDPSNPVLTTEAGSWDWPRLDFPEVVFDGNTYHMWYSGGGIFAWQIGYATSEDGTNWTKDNNNPVLKKGSAGNWDVKSVAFCSVIDSSGFKYKMWFGGGQSDAMGSIGYAESPVPAWKQMKPMDIAKGGSASCVIDNKIYVFGGADASGTPLSTAEVYKTETNDWSDLTPMPLELWQSNTEVINNKIYMVGGWRNIDGNWSTTNSTWEYDPEGVSWTAKKDCPANTAGNASCVLNGKLYILGGLKAMPVKDTSGQRQALVYDPASDTWDSLPEMLYEHINTRASVLDNKIYVFGGYFATPTETYITGKTEMYDPEEKVWTELADMPIAVGAHISVVHENKILVFGGDTGTFTLNQSSGTNSIQEYDPSKNSWRRMQSMPFKRSVMTGQKVDNYIYLIGGLKNSRDLTHPFSEVWRFDLALLKAFISVTGISLDKDSLSLTVGSTKTLVPTVSPNVASDHSISWNSGNPAVATVADGNVTGVASGEAHIYVITKDGNFKDSCLVAVKNISQVRFGSTGDPLNGITVTWKNSGTSDSIAWGHAANLEEGVFGGFMRENKFGVTLFDYTFPPLTAGTTIHYALFDSKDSRWTEKRTFHTASDPANNRFSFTAMGDSRTIPIYWQIISEATLDTDFTLFLGNIVENGRNVEEWNDYFEYGTEFIARELVYYCYGQHDEDANPPGFDAYLSMFTLPENELFYSFNYGNAVFICLNSEDPENEAQFRWLLETLEANKDQTWKIVFFSRPFYTNHNHAGEMDGYFNTWWKVFDGYGVDMILNSLVNNYQRTKPINRSISTTSPVPDYGGIGKGRCQIVSGGAGGDLDPMADQSLWWLEKSVSKNHFCNINIDGGILTFKAMDANRNVFDEFILDKSLTGPSDFNNTNIRDSRIYPNPSDGVFYVKVPPGERFSYRIFNSVGQLISEVQNHSVTANPVRIELTNQPMGIYYFELNTDKKRLVERIILY
jgi:N-acetylneuraminic acid mutarotase